ncbi:hypothetical protein [Novosphingobium jiangmenense]|uniref:Uncharacterized protein n=1 Tax=Novosphingobium jiangmenense TaxID=2791981 RepID=A0ABS0HHF8_9SPHN|nr:hypothetical protein [Novosphingobium jiangmenense]MBF9151702.1 hypothetical protein [Novosphingobium jiangmenense]
MKVRITDAELARCIGIGLAVTGKRGQSMDAEVSILRQLGRYDLFRNADAAEAMSSDVPLFPDDYGVARAKEVFEAKTAELRARHGDFNWPLKLDRTSGS